MRRFRLLEPVDKFVFGVCVVGLCLFFFFVVAGWVDIVDGPSRKLWLFGILVFVGELFPILLPRGDQKEEITTSTAFVFALLITFGTPVAVIFQGAASLFADLYRRKPWWKALFNVAQYSVALAVSGSVLALLGDAELGSATGLSLRDFGVILLAGLAYFLVNNVVVGAALAYAQRIPIVGYLRRDLAFHALSAGVLLCLAPIIAIAIESSLWLITLFILPLAAVYTIGRQAVMSEHQALHDSLTGLPNRALFRDRVAQAIRVARRDNLSVAVMIMDLDRFKEVNDTLGHLNGDLLLQKIGPCLRAALRDIDTVARLGGDEFGVLLPEVSDPVSALHVAEKLQDALNEPFVVQDLTLQTRMSIGIAFFPEHGDDVDSLIQKADVAMYIAKREGNGTGHEVYAAELDRHSASRLAMVAELRAAIEQNKDLELYYQPKVELKTGRVVGVEALVRWNHPRLGLTLPDHFIRLAELTGLIRPLTLLLLDEALHQSKIWREQGHFHTVAVNLSARDLMDPGLPDEIESMLRKQQMVADALEVEVTETSIMSDPVRAVEILNALSAMNLRIAVDDFGIGYSSLAYLKQLPVDVIKIDKSFVGGMAVDEGDAVIVRSTIELAHSLGLHVVAEGVESKEVLRALADLGCEVAQGNLLCPPIPAGELTAWLVHAPVVPSAPPL